MHARTPIAAALAVLLTAVLAGCSLVERGGEKTAEIARDVENSEFWQGAKENWNDFTSEVAARWDRLTEDDIDEVGGDRDELVEEIQETYSVTREEAEAQVDEWAASM